LDGPQATTVTRRLNDGREFEIVKVFHRPEELEERLRKLGWAIRVETTPRYFLIGEGNRAG
jgi:demethylmenaquinone methyltransferase/2-methoxy-6-polyprenyl-1,4-benzoquinol methylase